GKIEHGEAGRSVPPQTQRRTKAWHVHLRRHGAQKLFACDCAVEMQHPADQTHQSSDIKADEARKRGMAERSVEHLMKDRTPPRISFKKNRPLLGQRDI